MKAGAMVEEICGQPNVGVVFQDGIVALAMAGASTCRSVMPPTLRCAMARARAWGGQALLSEHGEPQRPGI
jgi:hypothetical protein